MGPPFSTRERPRMLNNVMKVNTLTKVFTWVFDPHAALNCYHAILDFWIVWNYVHICVITNQNIVQTHNNNLINA